MIVVPENASAGGHYAQISVRGLNLESSGNNTSSIVVPEVAVSTLFTISGNVNEAIRLDSSNIVPWHAQPQQELRAELKLTNTGNVHGLAVPELVLRKDGAEQRLQFAPRVILPGDTVEFSQIWTVPKEYGNYTAFASVRFGNAGTIVTSETERLVVSPSLTVIFNTAVCTWIALFLLQHRQRIKPAYRALLQKQY